MGHEDVVTTMNNFVSTVGHEDVVTTLSNLASTLHNSEEMADQMAVYARGLAHPMGGAGSGADDFVHVERGAQGDDTGFEQE